MFTLTKRKKIVNAAAYDFFSEGEGDDTLQRSVDTVNLSSAIYSINAIPKITDRTLKSELLCKFHTEKRWLYTSIFEKNVAMFLVFRFQKFGWKLVQQSAVELRKSPFSSTILYVFLEIDKMHLSKYVEKSYEFL